MTDVCVFSLFAVCDSKTPSCDGDADTTRNGRRSIELLSIHCGHYECWLDVSAIEKILKFHWLLLLVALIMTRSVRLPPYSLPNSFLLILRKLNCSSLLYHNNSLNTILPFIYLETPYSRLLMLLAVLVSSTMKVWHLHNIYLSFLIHAFAICVISDVFVVLLIKLLPALLPHFSFTLKLTIITIFYSICLHLKRIVFNFSSVLLLMLSPKLLNLIAILTF